MSSFNDDDVNAAIAASMESYKFEIKEQIHLDAVLAASLVNEHSHEEKHSAEKHSLEEKHSAKNENDEYDKQLNDAIAASLASWVSPREVPTSIIPIHSATNVLTPEDLNRRLLSELNMAVGWVAINTQSYFAAASKLHVDVEELKRLTREKNSLEARVQNIQAEILKLHSQPC